MDWMIAHPKWEDHFACSLSDLGLRGQRQGINLRSALRSLPIEQKQELIRHALECGLPAPSHSEAKRIARNWGITQHEARADFSPPSRKQWNALQQLISIRITARYEQYKTAQSKLFSMHAELPIEGALSVCNNPCQREDACQEARLALLEAIDRIEPNECFEAYARQWIKRRVRNFLMKERIPVQAPINLISKSFRGGNGAHPILEKAIREGTVQLDNTPSGHSEIAADPIYSPQARAMASDESGLITNALSLLTEKQREVVELRFGLGKASESQSLAQIAAQTGISRQQVFQREKRAMQILKTSLIQLQLERAGATAEVGSY